MFHIDTAKQYMLHHGAPGYTARKRFLHVAYGPHTPLVEGCMPRRSCRNAGVPQLVHQHGGMVAPKLLPLALL